MNNGRAWCVALLAISTLLAACAGPARPGTPRDSAGPGAVARGPSPPKILRAAIRIEPSAFIGSMVAVTTSTGGVLQVTELAHNWLTVTDTNSLPQPALGIELPSIEKGTWRVSPNGTMETTWRLQPNAVWHDGAPFTADDLAFGWEAMNDPAVAARSVAARLITAVEAPDPKTVVFKWSQILADADSMGYGTIEPLPRHLLGATFTLEKDAFVNNAYWSTGFVGLGPFKLTNWVAGSHLELARFDQYYRGPARLDGMVVRFITDPNTQLANMLSEEIDVLIPGSHDVEAANNVKQRWAGTGHQVLVAQNGRMRLVSPQYRPELQHQPALFDPRIRRALYQAIDRPTIVEVITGGDGALADSFIPPNAHDRREIESAIPQYLYDLTAATRAIAEAGWTRGAEGVLRNAAGAPLSFNMQVTPSVNSERELETTAAGWKEIGVQADLRILPPAIIRDPEAWHSYPGVEIMGQTAPNFLRERLHSGATAGPANRWNGANFGGYTNPAFDELVDRLAVTIPRAERTGVTRDMVRTVMAEVGIMPLYWTPDIIFALGKVKNIPLPSPNTQIYTWNSYEWDMVP
jgi:peptide/nickel transport system substrate-binding protein